MTGSITFSGIASGINSSGITDALFEQLTLQNAPRQNQIQFLTYENSSLEKLNTLLLDISSKLETFSTLNGGAGSLKDATSSDSTVVTAVAGSAASSGSFNVIVDSLANTASGSFDKTFSSTTDFIAAGPSETGSVQFTVGTGNNETNFSVFVSQATTAQDFVDQFNSLSDGKASASLINVGTENNPQLKIAFNSASTGTEDGTIAVSAGSSTLSSFTITQATDAQVTLPGVGTLTRASNNIDDVIPGVTLQLSGVGSATVTVENSSSAVSTQVEQFVSAYNAVVEFVNKENAVTVTQRDGENVNVFGELAKTSVDNDAISAFRSALSSATSSDGSLSFASLGVSTQRDGTLTFDKDAFETAFASSPQAATEVVTNLADKISGATGVVHEFTGFNRRIDNEIAGNNTEINNLNEKIAQVERSAQSRVDTAEKQFVDLEALMAQLNAQSSVIGSLLNVL